MATRYGTNYSETLRGTDSRDYIYGYGGNDLLIGYGGNDDIYGGAGHDDLFGGAGRDYLNGGSGDDNLTGGSGQDFLTGGYGSDYFIFDDGDTGVGYYNRDVINDFILDEDMIDLDQIDARTDQTGGQDFRWDGYESNPNDTVAGGISYRFVNGNTIVSGNTDSDRTVEFEIELKGTCDLASYDFFL